MAVFDYKSYNENRIKVIEKTYNEIGISIRNDDGTFKSLKNLLSELSELYYQKIEKDE